MDRQRNPADTPLVQFLRDMRASFDHLKEIGCTGFDCSTKALETLSKLKVALPGSSEKDETLTTIRTDLGDCKRCPLCRTRTHIVFGEGDENAPLVFIGEGPGFEEDRSGRPFVGKAGELLTKIIQAMNLTRDKVYIANIVKCRPPNNRNPEPGEISKCLPFLKKQLSAIHPTIVCALGSVAAKTLLQSDLPISRLRGRFHEMDGLLLMPTFHPAFLLRNPERKRDVWNDVQQIMKKLQSNRI
jgi:DNA polymerase